MGKISYSQFAKWDKCPYTWKLDYVDKETTFYGNIYTLFGTAVHETIQAYLVCYYERTIKQADNLPLRDILQYRMEENYKIAKEQYELFLHKQHDYGPQNIAVGQELKNDEEKRLSLMGIWFRINDKVERIKTLIMRGDDGSLENEGLVDSYSDISNYGVMAQVVARGKWAK